MVFVLALLVLYAPQTQPINKPPLAGQWISGEADRLQIKLDGQSLTVTGTYRREPLTYKLDGSPSRNVTVTAAGEQWKHESLARWVGNAVLIVTTTTRQTGQSWEWLTIYSMDSGGGGLTVVTVDHFHEDDGGMVTRQKSYRRSSGS